jgi:hypothetical protein
VRTTTAWLWKRKRQGQREARRRLSNGAHRVGGAGCGGGGVNEDEAEVVQRALTIKTMFDPDWWSRYGVKISPSLHSSMFGFDEPRAMRDFFEVLL